MNNRLFDANNISHPIHDLLKQLGSSINQLDSSVKNMDASSTELVFMNAIHYQA